MLSTPHDNAEMDPHLRARLLRRLRRAALRRAALAAIFPGDLSYAAGGRGLNRGGGDCARHRRWREGYRMARPAARREAGRALIPRQRRLAALARRALP